MIDSRSYLAWECDLPIAPASKHNSRKIRWVRGQMKIVLSDAAQAFFDLGVLLFKSQGVQLRDIAVNDKLALGVRIRNRSYQRDLDIQVVMDALQAANIIPNDRHIREFHAEIDDEVGDEFCGVEVYVNGKLPWKPEVEWPR